MDTIDGGACVIGRIRVKDPVGWARYRDGVAATLRPFDGVVVARGRDPRVFSGAADETDMVVLRFPSTAAAEGWFDSAAYQALIPLRDESADVVLVSYAT